MKKKVTKKYDQKNTVRNDGNNRGPKTRQKSTKKGFLIPARQ